MKSSARYVAVSVECNYVFKSLLYLIMKVICGFRALGYLYKSIEANSISHPVGNTARCFISFLLLCMCIHICI